MNIKGNLRRNLGNIPGWCSNRKIIVIESDDWGSVRMPSRRVFDTLSKAGLDLTSGDCCRYSLYDSLANSDDLSSLFEVLSSVKDKNGNSCLFTAISVVANPDFEKIKSNDYLQYDYEPFTETLKRYPGREDSFALWKEGTEKRIFIPQFHGREHLNVQVWLKSLQNNDREALLAFEHGLWSFNNKHPYGVSYQAAFELDDVEELQYQQKVVSEGLQLFEQLHGYKSRFFVPPNGPFNNQLEESAYKNGILYMSAAKFQAESLGSGKTRHKFHYLGQKNSLGQTYITRNCFFEPSQEGKDWVNECLNDINVAFRWYKPAIISSHRVNYIGAIDPSNRERGLKKLKELLNAIINKWPDVTFMSSEELGHLMVSTV